MKYSTQKACVFAMVCLTLKSTDFKPGMNASGFLTEETRKQVIDLVLEEFGEGNAPLKTLMTDEELVKYVPGLVSNHLRKDKRLNGLAGKLYIDIVLDFYFLFESP